MLGSRTQSIVSPFLANIAKKYPQSYNHLRSNSTGSIEQHVGNCRSPARNERLMKFIERGITSHDRDRSERPSQMHSSFSRADSTQDQQTQYKIFSDVACLTDEIMEKKRVCSGACGKNHLRIGMIMRLVLSDVNTPVENAEITKAHNSAGHQRRSHRILADLYQSAM